MKIIVKVIKLAEWYWQTVMPSSNIQDDIKDEQRLASFRYPTATQVFIIPVFLN